MITEYLEHEVHDTVVSALLRQAYAMFRVTHGTMESLVHAHEGNTRPLQRRLEEFFESWVLGWEFDRTTMSLEKALDGHRATLSNLPTALTETLYYTLSLEPANASQRIAQSEMVKAIRTALDARRHRIVVSESTVGRVKWAGILLMGLFTLVAIAMVHSDNRLTCAIALTLFASGIALSLLLIAAYSRPFTGEISVRPDLLKQVITSGQPSSNP